MKRFNTQAIGLAAVLTLGGATGVATAFHNHAQAGQQTEPTRNIVQIAASNPDFSTLVAAVTTAELGDVLSGDGPFTVFAPTNAAFNKLGADTVQSLLTEENRGTLTDILTFHVVQGELSFTDIVGSTKLTTVQGQRINVGSNGEAFTVNGAVVVARDIRATNGVIHVIDTVITPESKNIAEVATEAGGFDTLLAAAKAAGLVPALTGEGPLTVLAPTDEAFAKLGQDTINDLLKPENKEKLANILKHHVIPGRVFGYQALAARNAATILGSRVSFNRVSGAVRVGDANILATDIDASNGVIHVIDSVLMPPQPYLSFHDKGVTSTIELAINKGVPLFNNGNPAACAAVYEVAITALLERDDLSRDVRESLTKAVREGRYTHNMSDRAWAFRRGLDNALRSLDGGQMMLPARMASRGSH